MFSKIWYLWDYACQSGYIANRPRFHPFDDSSSGCIGKSPPVFGKLREAACEPLDIVNAKEGHLQIQI
jgi:hypothetical protein